MASVGFENRGDSTAGGRGWRVIDFAYDTDWTGLRNWTGFLAGLASLPSLAVPSRTALSLPPTFLYRECLYAWPVISTRTRPYIYVGVTYTLNVSRSVYRRETKKGSLSYLWQGTSKGIGLERAICAIFENVFMSVPGPLLPLSY